MTARSDQARVALCPVCGAVPDPEPISVYTVERAALHFCPPWRDADRHARLRTCLSKLWPDGRVQIRHCSQCGFGFGDPFVGGNETFYRILHEQMGYPQWRWDYDIALRDAGIARLDRGRVLDVGAGTGNFLQHFGPQWERHAIESSDFTRAALEGHGIVVHSHVNSPRLRSSRGTFDVITIFQVLEHIADFYPLLRGCRDLLKPNGTIVITVPSADAMLRQERITGCPDMPPNHINRWTPTSLGYALRQCGFAPGTPTFEPSSLSNVGSNLYLRVLADAARPASVASRIYRIRQKRFRAPLLRFLGGGWAMLRLARHARQLCAGGAFALAATRVDEPISGGDIIPSSAAELS